VEDPQAQALDRSRRRAGWFMVIWSAGVFVWSAIFLHSLIGCVLSVAMMLMGAVLIFGPNWWRLTTVCTVLAIALLIVAMVMALRMRGIV